MIEMGMRALVSNINYKAIRKRIRGYRGGDLQKLEKKKQKLMGKINKIIHDKIWVPHQVNHSPTIMESLKNRFDIISHAKSFT